MTIKFEDIAFQKLYLSNYYKTHAPEENKVYEASKRSINIHRGLMVLGSTVSILTLSASIGAILAVTGHLPAALNSLQILDHATLNGAIISIVLSSTLMPALGIVHKVRSKKLNENLERTLSCLESHALDELTKQLEDNIVKSWTAEAVIQDNEKKSLNLEHQFYKLRYVIQSVLTNNLKVVLGIVNLNENEPITYGSHLSTINIEKSPQSFLNELKSSYSTKQ